MVREMVFPIYDSYRQVLWTKSNTQHSACHRYWRPLCVDNSSALTNLTIFATRWQ